MPLRTVFLAVTLACTSVPLAAATVKPVAATGPRGSPQNTIDGTLGNWWEASQGDTVTWHFDAPQTIGGLNLEPYEEYSNTYLGSFTARFFAGDTLVRTYQRWFIPEDGGSNYWPRMGFGSGVVYHGVTHVELTLGGSIDVTNPDFGNSGSTGIGEVFFYTAPVPLPPGLALTAAALALLGAAARARTSQTGHG